MLTDDAKPANADIYIMECCFSVVCKECNGIGGTNDSANQEDQAPKKTAKICLACLEPVKGNVSGGKVALSLGKYSVLATLLASINEAQKKAEDQRNTSSSLFGYITGAS